MVLDIVEQVIDAGIKEVEYPQNRPSFDYHGKKGSLTLRPKHSLPEVESINFIQPTGKPYKLENEICCDVELQYPEGREVLFIGMPVEAIKSISKTEPAANFSDLKLQSAS